MILCVHSFIQQLVHTPYTRSSNSSKQFKAVGTSNSPSVIASSMSEGDIDDLYFQNLGELANLSQP